MSDTDPAAVGSEDIPFQRFRIALGMLPQPTGKPPFIWLERGNAIIVGALVALGVPLLALSQFGTTAKLLVLIAWLAVIPQFFAYFEGRELIGQMLGRGTIKPDQLTKQQGTAQGPFYGCVIAAFIWLVVYAVHVAINVVIVLNADPGAGVIPIIAGQLLRSFAESPVAFGIVEWFILAHTWVSTNRTNHIMYNVGNIFSKATPLKEQVERRIMPGQ